MADNADRVDWAKVLACDESGIEVGPRSKKHRPVEDSPTDLDAVLNASTLVCLCCMAIFLLVLLFAASRGSPRLVLSKSPVFLVVSCVATCVALLISTVVGALWFLFTGERSLVTGVCRSLPIGEPGFLRDACGLLMIGLAAALLLLWLADNWRWSARSAHRYAAALVAVSVGFLLGSVLLSVYFAPNAKTASTSPRETAHRTESVDLDRLYELLRRYTAQPRPQAFYTEPDRHPRAWVHVDPHYVRAQRVYDGSYTPVPFQEGCAIQDSDGYRIRSE